MFGKKQKEIDSLRKWVSDLILENTHHTLTIGELQCLIEELEKTNQPSYDMNTLFAAVLDYRRCLKTVGAPDPVEGRHEIRKVFEKYRVKF